MKSIVAACKLNAPNGATLAIITAAGLEGWLKVLLVATSIVCTILVTRAQINRRRR